MLGTVSSVIAGVPASRLPDAEEHEEEIRRRFGGQLAPPPITQTRWLQSDLELAQQEADVGDISRAARLCRWIRRDGVLSGVLSTRTGGLVRLRKMFTGDPEMVAVLKGRKGKRGLFDRMFPAAELSLLAADGILLGVGVAEMLPVEGGNYKRMRRLEPEYLRYRWNEDRWYYNSIAGPIPITPGDGRWILHIPGGEVAPWNNGLWMCVGRASIAKEHAWLRRENYSDKLANPARVAVAPQGATEEQSQSWFQRVASWGINTVFQLRPGYDVRLLESNGRGYEVFQDSIATSREELIIALGSSPVLVDGGTGFSNADIHKSIRADVIKEDAEGLAHTLNTQGIPPWVNDTYGADALEEAPEVEWDIRPPKDLKAEADSMKAAADAFEAWNKALVTYGKRVDETAIVERFGVPIEGDEDGDGQPDDAKDESPDSGETQAANDDAVDVDEAA